MTTDAGTSLGRGPRAPRVESAYAVAVVTAAIAVTIFAAYRLRDTYVGDAAVYLPYARNAADGHLFQFNVGEFSSGSTSPLWALMLAVPHLLGVGIGGAKVVSCVMALVGFLTTLVAARRISRSWAAASTASLIVLGTMTFPALSLFESGLAVTLSAAALIVGDGALRAIRDSEQLTLRTVAPLIMVWAALPLARPDAVILVVAHALALVLAAPVPVRVRLRGVGLALLAAAVPATLYFGYSLLELGTFSTSSTARTFALRESTERHLGPLFLSGGGVRELLNRPWTFAVIPALGGLVLAARTQRTRWVAQYGVLTVVGYVAFLTFIAPGVYDTPRYLLPIVPVVACGLAVLIARPRHTAARWLAVAVAVVLVGGPSLRELRQTLQFARSIGITNAEVFERDVTAEVDRRARSGDVLLSYEVQLRYYLRRDVEVLSQDGITDPKVRPYQPTGDMTGYLKRYRPRWWIADRNVTARNYLRGSVLERALLAFRASRSLRSSTLDGIEFRLVRRRDRPLAVGFGGWEMLFELSYDRVAG